jgi:hypothetical protein
MQSEKCKMKNLGRGMRQGQVKKDGKFPGFSGLFRAFPRFSTTKGPCFRDFRDFPGGAIFNHRWTQMHTDGKTPKGRF